MAIDDGMYILRFRAPMGVIGGGVAILRDGKIQGGDSMCAYLGDYRAEGADMVGSISAKVHTQLPGMAPVFGAANATVDFRGVVSDGRGSLTATSPQAPGVNLKVEIERYN